MQRWAWSKAWFTYFLQYSPHLLQSKGGTAGIITLLFTVNKVSATIVVLNLFGGAEPQGWIPVA